MSTVRYSGMNASSGHAITDNEHIAQSIGDILLTPIGSRVMRRAYGSQLFNLIDQPVDNAITKLRVMSAIYSALYLWEPRISLTSITLSAPVPVGWLPLSRPIAPTIRRHLMPISH